MRPDWWTEDSYLPWVDPLVQIAFGEEIDLHWDLYLETHAHRLQHGPDCSAYPSPPSRAPLWSALSRMLPYPPTTILEIGTAIGYSAVLIAEAFPQARLYTVEHNLLHRRLAEGIFDRAGVADRITIVPSVTKVAVERCDLVFVDGPLVDLSQVPERSILIDDVVKPSFRRAAIAALEPLRQPSDDPDGAVQRAQNRYRDAVAELLRATRRLPPCPRHLQINPPA